MKTLLLVSVLLVAAFVAGCSEEKTVTPDSDSVPPNTVEDLSAESTSVDQTVLSWTAPGDDGVSGRAETYDIHFSSSVLTPETWASADSVPGTIPTPGPSGVGETFVLTGIPDGDLYFGLRTADDAGNWSDLSNIAMRIAALIPPDPVINLAVESTEVLWATLTWTVPLAAEERTIDKYDIRYHDTPITDLNWAEATSTAVLPDPRRSGESESFFVGGLERDTSYYFAIRATDDFGQSSGLSNVVSTTTDPYRDLRLIFTPERNGSPDWSPDGESVVFHSFRGKRWEIYLYTFATGTTTKIATSVRNPRWSPDGSVLSVISNVGNFDEHRELGLLRPISGSGVNTIARHPGLHVSTPGWSPDGTKIAYFLGSRDLYVVPVGGGDPELLLEGWSPRGTRIDWTADGESIIFGALENDNIDLWMLPVNGGEPSRLTSDSGNELHPSLSPDGLTILFSSDQAGNFDIWEMPVSGGVATQVTTGARDDFLPSASPDGLKIAYERIVGGNKEIWLRLRD